MLSWIVSERQRIVDLASRFEVEALPADDVVRAVEQLGAIRGVVEDMLGRAAKRVEDLHAHRATGERDAAALCSRLTGSGVRDVRQAIDTATKLERLPATAAAARAGALSARHARMIADAASINPDAEADLIATASQGLVPLKDACIAARAVVEDEGARSARQQAARCLRTWRSDDGMVEGRFRLPPEIGSAVKKRLDLETQRIFRARHAEGIAEPHDRYAADALVEAVMSGGSSVRAAANVTVHVLIDHAALVHGRVAEGERCEIPGVGPVSVAWVRDVLGSAFVTAIIRRGKDVTTVAHFGRHIPAELRTAMIVGGRECAIEGCDARGYLEIDHSEVDHARGGATALSNLERLCSVHHARKTQGWKLGPRDPSTGKRSLRAPGSDPPVAA
jgi:hypothetical protein